MENQKLANEVAQGVIRKAITGTKIVEQKGNTGISWFQGKDRLCKVLFSKKGLVLEINVDLPAEVEAQFNLTKIPASVAHAKHLGTMKYYYKTTETDSLATLVKHMVTSFKEVIKAKEAEQGEAK